MGEGQGALSGVGGVNRKGLQEALQAYLNLSTESRLGPTWSQHASRRLRGFCCRLLVEMIPETMEVEEFEGLVESLRSADLRGVMT